MVPTVPAASSSDADVGDMAATAAAAGRRTSSDNTAGADDGGGDSALLLFPFMLHVGVVLIITWLFSIKSLFFLVMSFIYLHWVEKQGREREQRWIRHEERRKAHVAGLGDGETVRWLNRAITSMWPVCLESFSSQQFLMPIAPWFFNSYKPWGVSKVLLQKLHLGNRAPIFTLIRALDQTSDGDHLVMEAAMEFASGDDMSAEMLVALHQWFGGFRTTFYISKLHIEGKVKIAVKFVDGWPVIGRIRFCFAHPPYIQMTASPLYKGGIDVTYFPGADRWLEATLAAALEQSLLEPNMLVVNLEMLANSAAFLNPRAEQAVASTHDNKSPPIAMVHVKVVDAKNLRIADRNGFSDPYVKVSLGLQGWKKTAVKKKNLNPIWNEKFQFPISSWDLPNILVLHVLDKDFAFDDSLGSCMVHVSNYRDGEWHEENLDLEMTQHKQKKKVGQLRFAIMVEESITQTFEDNPSVGGVSSQPGTRELYMNGNAESTQSSPASTRMFARSLNTDLPPANNTPGDQKQKGKTSHSRSSSASGLETQTTTMPPESQAREGEVIDIIDVPIGPRGTFTILHPGKLSPRNWPCQNPGRTRRGKGSSQEKVEYEGSEGQRPIKRYHNWRRSAGASQESLPAVEKESEQSVSSMEHSRELELLCAPEHNGTVMFILEPNTTPIQSLASDEPPPEMSMHPPTLTPILSNQERANLEDEDDEKTQTVELTPNGTHFTRPHHDEDDVIMDSQNETTPPKSKKGGWWEKAAQRMKRKQKTHLDTTTTTTEKDQVVNSPELIEYSDEFDNGEAAIYSSQPPEEDEPLIHEDEKKIINSTQSGRGSSLRNISEKTLAKLGLGPKKP